MRKQTEDTAVYIVLYAIRHNRKNYKKGDFIEIEERKAKFLLLAKCVRKPTDEELEAWQAEQDAGAMGMDAGFDTMETAKLQDQISTESKPKTDDKNNVVTGETVAVHADEVVEGSLHEDQSKQKNVYNGWLKKDLNAELDKRGIEHDAKATNDELEQLLLADDAK